MNNDKLGEAYQIADTARKLFIGCRHLLKAEGEESIMIEACFDAAEAFEKAAIRYMETSDE